MSMSPPTDARRGRPSRCDFQVRGGIAGSHNAKRSSRGNYHELELQLPGGDGDGDGPEDGVCDGAEQEI